MVSGGKQWGQTEVHCFAINISSVSLVWKEEDIISDLVYYIMPCALSVIF